MHISHNDRCDLVHHVIEDVITDVWEHGRQEVAKSCLLPIFPLYVGDEVVNLRGRGQPLAPGQDDVIDQLPLGSIFCS